MSNLLWNVFETVVLAEAWLATKVGEWLGAAAPADNESNPGATLPDVFWYSLGLN
jgi:hypothetical protein